MASMYKWPLEYSLKGNATQLTHQSPFTGGSVSQGTQTPVSWVKVWCVTRHSSPPPLRWDGEGRGKTAVFDTPGMRMEWLGRTTAYVKKNQVFCGCVPQIMSLESSMVVAGKEIIIIIKLEISKLNPTIPAIALTCSWRQIWMSTNAMFIFQRNLHWRCSKYVLNSSYLSLLSSSSTCYLYPLLSVQL